MPLHPHSSTPASRRGHPPHAFKRSLLGRDVAKEDAKDANTEEYEFQVPDFDEKAFIHKEMTSFKTTAILFGWGIIAALVTWGVFMALDGAKTTWYIGIGIVIAFLYALRVIYPKLNIDVAHFKRKEWMGTGFLLFFTWLAFFIFFANPPVSDFADPHVAAYETPGVQQIGGDVILDFWATDNGNIDHVEFTLTQGETTIANADDLTKLGGGQYQYVLTGAGGTYAYHFEAIDAKGNHALIQGNATISQKALDVEVPAILERGEEVLVFTSMKPCTDAENRDGGECLRTVYLDLDTPIHMAFDALQGAWVVNTNFAGLTEGEHTFNVVAVTQNQFHGAHTIVGTTVEAGPFTTTIEGPFGELVETPSDPVGVAPAYRQTPGFEVAFLAVGLIGLVALRRK